jgi:hypothetical protein
LAKKQSIGTQITGTKSDFESKNLKKKNYLKDEFLNPFWHSLRSCMGGGGVGGNLGSVSIISNSF